VSILSKAFELYRALCLAHLSIRGHGTCTESYKPENCWRSDESEFWDFLGRVTSGPVITPLHPRALGRRAHAPISCSGPRTCKAVLRQSTFVVVALICEHPTRTSSFQSVPLRHADDLARFETSPAPSLSLSDDRTDDTIYIRPHRSRKYNNKVDKHING
jgi:hypothetical protein